MGGMNVADPRRYSMSVQMYRGGGGGSERPRTAPPDLPSLLLDARICYLGMPVRSPTSFLLCILSVQALDLTIYTVFTCRSYLQLLSYSLLNLCG